MIPSLLTFFRRLPRVARGCLVVALGSGILGAQTVEVPREKIGLVLSGGGARGCAHVGVLKVLEDLRVPVDYVVGTSMGSIVGGMYVYGLSPSELVAEVTRDGDRAPWSRLLLDAPDRAHQSFRRKQEDLGFLIDVGVGYRDGRFRLPKGLRQGQNLLVELLAILAEAHDLETFDELPIPFRAVAVELATGKEVILGKGNLPAALRASMSLPGIFAPAIVDGRALLDGGLVNNVPIESARALGATRLIVVDIGTPLSATTFDSLLDVSTQVMQILTQQNVDQSLVGLRPGDVLIRPDLGAITASDFDRAAESIALGEQAAVELAEQLRKFSVSEAAYSRFLAAQRRVPAPVQVRRVLVENHSGISDEVLRSQLRATPGKTLDIAKLRQDIDAIYGLGNFESVTFALLRVGSGQRDLVVRVTGKSWGPTYVRLGLALESDLEGASGFNFAGQLSYREINELGAELLTSFQLGDETGLSSEFYQPVAADSPVFVAARASASVFDVEGVDAAMQRSVVDLWTFGGGVDVGVNIARWAQFRIGYARFRGDVEGAVPGQPAVGFDFDEAFVRAQLEVDTLDNPAFPRFGVRGRAAWSMAQESLGADQDYRRLTTGVGAFASLDRTTAGLLVRYETTLAGRLPIYQSSSLGGFAMLSGLQRDQLLGQHLGLVTAVVRQQIAGRHAEALGFPVYVGGTLEMGNTWSTRSDVFDRWRVAGSVFTAVDTPIGPLYLAYGMTDGGGDSFYLFVGEIF